MCSRNRQIRRHLETEYAPARFLRDASWGSGRAPCAPGPSYTLAALGVESWPRRGASAAFSLYLPHIRRESTLVSRAMNRLAPIFLLAALAACVAPPVNRSGVTPLATVERVDLNRYVGVWREIARFPNSFETDCTGVTATYAKREDGLIDVENVCFKKSLDGERVVANGRARVVDSETNAKLKVSFFGPFWGDYWVIGLDPDYQWAIVGEPSGRYLWVLARRMELTGEQRAEILGRLSGMGYDITALEWTVQK